MPPIKNLRDEWAMVLGRELIAADLQRVMFEKAQGAINVQGTPIASLVKNAYDAADVALKVRGEDMAPEPKWRAG